MVRSLVFAALVAVVPAAGCVATKPMQSEDRRAALQDGLPKDGQSGAAAMKPTPVVAEKKDFSPISAIMGSRKGPPAENLLPLWTTQLKQLPDPTRNGAMRPGIVGQVFLLTDRYLPAEITGTLTFAVSDATERPTGQPVKAPNTWTFEPDVLRRLVTMDERLGKCVTVFLPWPEEWSDVNRVQIQSRYDQPGSYALYSAPTTVTLDFFTSGSQITTSSSRFTAGGGVMNPKGNNQAVAARSGPPANPAIQQAGFQQPMNGMTQQQGGFQQPTTGMAQPQAGFQQPMNGMAQPQPGFQMPVNGMAQPQGGFQQPTSGTAQQAGFPASNVVQPDGWVGPNGPLPQTNGLQVPATMGSNPQQQWVGPNGPQPEPKFTIQRHN